MLYHTVCNLVTILTVVSTFVSAVSGTVAVTGVHTGVNKNTGARPMRLNILEFDKNVPRWSLYVQALNAMQAMPESDLLSWFQLAGIHGRPYGPWDSVGQTSGAPLTGFCTHDSVLFLTWHRPYMALFEQQVHKHAVAIAKTYPTNMRKTYENAAKHLRIPYWDWAANSQMPPVTTVSTVKITTPTGVKYVNNPLYQYKFNNFPLSQSEFPTDSSQGDAYLAAYPATVRSPDQYLGASDFNAANSVLANDNLMQRTWYALTKAAYYDNFATITSWGSSIEGVHGSIHNDVGGSYGHMTALSYSAFDPIFFLHHANVDRMAALWGAMYPNSWMTPAQDGYGTYAIVAGSTDSSGTPLEPWSTNTGGNWYTSDSSRYMSTFGYSYPEIEDWHQDAASLKANVTAQVNSLYNPNGVFGKRSMNSGKRQSTEQMSEWFVELQVSKADLHGTQFIIRVFLGDVPTDPTTWAVSPNLVGSMVILPPPPSALSGTTNLNGVQILAYDEMSLVTYLSNNGFDGSEAAVPQFLADNLSWQIQLINGTVLPTTMVPSLLVQVQSENVTAPASITETPTWYNQTSFPMITHGKQGGLQLDHN